MSIDIAGKISDLVEGELIKYPLDTFTDCLSTYWTVLAVQYCRRTEKKKKF